MTVLYYWRMPTVTSVPTSYAAAAGPEVKNGTVDSLTDLDLQSEGQWLLLLLMTWASDEDTKIKMLTDAHVSPHVAVCS